jgi:hypothetical protein
VISWADSRSTVILVVASVNGCQVVALLPSMAARAYWPGTIKLSVSIVNEMSVSFITVLHCARFPGTRAPFADLVGIMSDSPTFKVLHSYQLARRSHIQRLTYYLPVLALDVPICTDAVDVLPFLRIMVVSFVDSMTSKMLSSHRMPLTVYPVI